MRALCEAHFAGRIHAREERVLRQHLPGCAECRAMYREHLLISRLDPNGLSRHDRLARALRLQGGRRVRWVLMPLAAAACAALVWVAVSVVPATGPPDMGGIASRGGGSAPERRTELLLYRYGSNRVPRRVDGAITTDDELAFAYRNGAAKKRLLVVGRDHQGRYHWYYPAWVEAQDNPVTVPIKQTAGIHELPEAVAHRLSAGRLQLLAVFTDLRVSVRQAEKWLGQQAAHGRFRLPLPDARQVTIELRVTEAKAVGKGLAGGEAQ